MQSELKPCPFCGAKPHRGMTKVKHCQLHGDPYQDFRIWCPHGCASVERSQSYAIAAWNTRASDAEITRLTEALRAAEEREKGLREKWAALDKALADNIIETDQPHRVRWEGEWHYGPLADAYFAMIGAVRDCARQALAGAKP